MQDDGVRPDTRTLTALICALGAGGLVDDALATFRTMASALLTWGPCCCPGSCHDPRVACGAATCELLPCGAGLLLCCVGLSILGSESDCHSLGSLFPCCVPVLSWPQPASAALHVCTGGVFWLPWWHLVPSWPLTAGYLPCSAGVTRPFVWLAAVPAFVTGGGGWTLGSSGRPCLALSCHGFSTAGVPPCSSGLPCLLLAFGNPELQQLRGHLAYLRVRTELRRRCGARARGGRTR